MTGGGNDLFRGWSWLAALDERTCLDCLQLDGQQTTATAPLHEGCRCVRLPVLATWDGPGHILANLSPGSRASAIGPVPADGGLYKAYLLARASAIGEGLYDAELYNRLCSWIETKQAEEPSDGGTLASVWASVIALNPEVDQSLVERTLCALPWTGPFRHGLIDQCARHGSFQVVDDALKRMAAQVPEGVYAARHRAQIFRDAAKAVSESAIDKAIAYLERALELDPQSASVALTLGAMLRRIGSVERARSVIEHAITKNPEHKGLRSELGKAIKALGS
jgi:tetratricopeptide (TPR) repeat protein